MDIANEENKQSLQDIFGYEAYIKLLEIAAKIEEYTKKKELIFPVARNSDDYKKSRIITRTPNVSLMASDLDISFFQTLNQKISFGYLNLKDDEFISFCVNDRQNDVVHGTLERPDAASENMIRNYLMSISMDDEHLPEKMVSEIKLQRKL